MPEAYEPARRYGNGGDGGRRGGRGGGGLGGVVKFLLFTVVLAALVLLIALTALRPLVNGAILTWAADSPAALNLPFVADLVREDLGPALTESASDDPEQVEFVVRGGRHGLDDRGPPRRGRPHPRPAGLRLHRE